MLTLTAAVLAILVMSSLLAPPIGGDATRSAVPAPPAVGSCGDLLGGELVVLDCAQTHTVEVSYTWTASVPAAGPQPTFAVCSDKVRDYVGSPPSQDTEAHQPGRWSLPLRYRPVLAAGPNGDNLQDWSWQACLVAPMGPTSGYRGQVRATPATGPVSPTLRICYEDPGTALAIVACTSPHFGEVVATQLLPAPRPASEADSPSADAQFLTSCASVARSVTGAVDPTYGGRLQVTVLSDLGRQPFRADFGVYYTSAGSDWLVCSLESANGRRLLNSVAGIGNGALPFE